MDVNWVGRIATSMPQLLDLILAQDGSRQDPVLYISPTHSIYLLEAIDAGESKALANVGL